jgi:hypothetical protein
MSRLSDSNQVFIWYIGFNILRIQYPNFIDIYEVYYFEDQVFLISEYIDFLLEDLLKCSVYPTESEIVYIISQVR